MTLTRKEVENMIRQRLGQIIGLSHHLSEYPIPFESTVNENTETMPSLDKKLQKDFELLAEYLNERFGTDIKYALW